MSQSLPWGQSLDRGWGMLDVLVASGAHLELRPRWLTTSVLTHTALIGLAVAATQSALNRPKVTADSAILLYVPVPDPPPAPEQAKPAAAPPVVIAEPPPKGFQTIAAPADIPDVIPPVDLTQRALDPRDFTGRGVEGGVAAGVVGGTGKVDEEAGLDAIYEATFSDSRFEQAVMISQPAPRYPKPLEEAGIEGRVALEFVIDTTGKVEPTSVKVLERTHAAFESAAREAMAGAVFHPARLGSRPVRQLTRQAIRFMLAR
jgi:periplasmic protein TonB